MQSDHHFSWWNSGWSKQLCETEEGSIADEKVLHRKRLAAILRYIASMHQDLSSAGVNRCRFVRPLDDNEGDAEDFFQSETNTEDENGVLFSTNDFRKLISIEAIDDNPGNNQDSPPFSFYAPKSSVTRNHGPALGAATKSRRVFTDFLQFLVRTNPSEGETATKGVCGCVLNGLGHLL